jgi:putative ABC transport system permease protein
MPWSWRSDIFISCKEKLGLEKDIIISVSRTIKQLLVIGYILEYIFNKYIG